MSDDGIIIDRSRHTLHITRTYSASVDRAWWAWTDAETIAKWWGPTGWIARVHEMDVRPGGLWRFQIEPADGSAKPVRGIATYGEVTPNTLLTYEDSFADETWQPDGTGTFPTAVTFMPAGAGCRVEVAASFPDGDTLRRAVEAGMADGYVEALERLDHLLTTT